MPGVTGRAIRAVGNFSPLATLGGVRSRPAREGEDATASRRSDRDEQQLAARLRNRDPGALEDVYARFGRTTFGFLLKALDDRAAAEDIQQQVFLEVWQRAAQYDPQRAGLLTWIMLIARSRAVDHLRRRIPEPQDPSGAVALLEAGGAQVDALVEQWHMAHLLRQLPREEADLLRQRFWEDRNQREIASETGIPLGTVKMRMVSGLRRLRAMMEAEA
jgi:RNA polymerase sigma-70 factor, ECF subfamily